VFGLGEQRWERQAGGQILEKRMDKGAEESYRRGTPMGVRAPGKWRNNRRLRPGTVHPLLGDRGQGPGLLPYGLNGQGGLDGSAPLTGRSRAGLSSGGRFQDSAAPGLSTMCGILTILMTFRATQRRTLVVGVSPIWR